MIVEVIDGYELRSSDGMNWQVFQYRELKPRGKYKDRAEDSGWVALPSYHATVPAGVQWIADHIPKSAKNRDARKTLDQFLEDYAKIKTSITKSANKMAKAVKDGSHKAD